jgi:hypothetical protein
MIAACQEREFNRIDPPRRVCAKLRQNDLQDEQDSFDPVGVVTMGWVDRYPGFHPGLFGFNPFGIDRISDPAGV